MIQWGDPVTFRESDQFGLVECTAGAAFILDNVKNGTQYIDEMMAAAMEAMPRIPMRFLMGELSGEVGQLVTMVVLTIPLPGDAPLQQQLVGLTAYRDSQLYDADGAQVVFHHTVIALPNQVIGLFGAPGEMELVKI